MSVYTTQEAIADLIKEYVRADIYGDIYGHEVVADHLADRIDTLLKENEKLKAELEKVMAERAPAAP